MPNKSMVFDMIFKADTSQAKKSIAELSQSLSKIATRSSDQNFFDAKKITEASKAAQELQGHLHNAINVDTGKLDLNKFATSLKNSGQDLNYFKQNLSKAGAQGQQAFQKLSYQIAQTQQPVISLNKHLSSMWENLKRTASWTISSTIINGFTNGVRQAFNYAEQLNTSLNNIRIVTGQSSEEMEKFAERANRTAKELSTTTTAYTNGALIYYQQGKWIFF